MSRISFGTNIASINAQRRLGEASDLSSNIASRLSSGQRINRASDDPASLSIISSLGTNAKVFGQGIRNLNDGISLLNIASSAISTLTDITVRARELAAQAANGSYTNTQRLALDKEAQALSDEFTRIIQSTKFNNVAVLNGGLADGITLQAGYGTDGGIFSTLGGSKGTGTFTASTNLSTTQIQGMALGDIDNDGDLDMYLAGHGYNVTSFNNGDGTFSSPISAGNGIGLVTDGKLVDINNDGNLDIVAVGISGGTSAKLAYSYGDGSGNFSSAVTMTIATAITVDGFAVGDMDSDGDLDIFATGTNGGGLFVFVKNNGNGSFTATTSMGPSSATSGKNLQMADVNLDGKLDLVAAAGTNIIVNFGNGDGTFMSSITTAVTGAGAIYGIDLGDFNNDGVLDIAATSFNGATHNLGILSGNGNGTFTNVISYQNAAQSLDPTFVDFNGDGLLDIVHLQDSATNSVVLRAGNGNGTFNSATSFNTSSTGKSLAFGDLNADGAVDMVQGSNSGTKGAFLNGTQSGTNPLLDFSLKTIADARYAQTLFSQKLNQLTLQQGQIGSFQSRLTTALNSLMSTKDEYMIAGSRIGDADVAAESSEYVRTQILQNSAAAVLAQANQSPQIGLELLRQAN